MASLVKELVEAGIHFGHRTNNWNPKMKPYIFGKRTKIHIIDVKATIKGLLLARKFLTRVVARGDDVLFVGTKRQARACIEKHVVQTGMHWVTERWLGGTLTNFRTIRDRLKRLEELEGLEESGEIKNYSKKMESQLNREKNKINRNLAGLRNMSKLPGALVIIDVGREETAVKEAKKLGIPTVCLIDTDSDPDYADIPIPGNDDAMRAIELVVMNLCAAIMEGKSGRVEQAEGKDEPTAAPQRRRSSRAQFRAEEPPPSEVQPSPDTSQADEALSPVAASPPAQPTPEAVVAAPPNVSQAIDPAPTAQDDEGEAEPGSAISGAPSDDASTPGAATGSAEHGEQV